MADALLQDPERKAINPTRVFDGWNDLSGGMDSSRSPEVIGQVRYALGINVVTRDGMPRTRPPFVRLELVADDDATLAAYRAGFFQGASSYYNPATGAASLVAVLSGRVYAINPFSGMVTPLSTGDLVNSASARHYFCQAESFLVINNGVDAPLIYNGATLRRATADEVLSGTVMAYGQGRLFVASPDRLSFIAGDLVYGGSTQSSIIQQSSKATAAGEPRAQIKTTAPHNLSVGNSVTISGHSSSPSINGTWTVAAVPSTTTFQISAELVSGGAGGTVSKALDGQESDVLRFTEYKFLNEKGVFRLPATMGRITAMAFPSVQDTAMGQGDLIVWGERGACSFLVSAPRSTWLDIQIQRVTFPRIGCTGSVALAPVNGDIFFRSWDGIRSYRNARAEQQNYGLTPVSGEVREQIEHDEPSLLPLCSLGFHDNRLLITASPLVVKADSGANRTVFQTIVSLDFDQVSRITPTTAAFDGIWTGLNVQQLVVGTYGDTALTLALCYQPQESGEQLNEVWVIRPELLGQGDDQWVDTFGVVRNQQIGCVLETRAFTFEKPMRLKKLVRADFWLRGLMNPTDFRAYWRPDIYPGGWFRWLGFTTSGSECAVLEPDGECMTPRSGPGFMPQVALGTPPETPDAGTIRPAANGYSFQLRLEWDGAAQIVKSLIAANEQVESVSGRPPEGAEKGDEKSPDCRGSLSYIIRPSSSAFDFAILRYIWTEAGGSDLDTRTAIIGRNVYVGYGRADTDPDPRVDIDYLTWGGEHGSFQESVLINFQQMHVEIPAQEVFEITVRGLWHASRGNGNVTLQFQTFLGGTMTADGDDFRNIGGVEVETVNVVTNVVTVGGDTDGDDLATLRYTVGTKTAEIILT